MITCNCPRGTRRSECVGPCVRRRGQEGGPPSQPLTLARAVLMFSMFSMLLTQLLGTLLQASRI